MGGQMGGQMGGRMSPEDPEEVRANALERESSLLTTYWSGSTDVFGVPASRHGSLNPLFALYPHNLHRSRVWGRGCAFPPRRFERRCERTSYNLAT